MFGYTKYRRINLAISQTDHKGSTVNINKLRSSQQEIIINIIMFVQEVRGLEKGVMTWKLRHTIYYLVTIYSNALIQRFSLIVNY